jgi:hypothetical protein
VLFRKRQKRGSLPGARGADAAAPGNAPKLHNIDFDRMLKGSIYKRGKETVRQYGVTVRGSTRLVTSGEVVDDETYRALLDAGAIQPDPPPAESPQEDQIPISED